MQPPSYRLLVPSLLLVLAGAPARGEIVERIVAKVNGDIITLSEFEMRQIQEAQAARVEPDRIGAYLRDNNARILNEAIDDLLLYQRALETGLKLPPSALNQMIEDIKKEHKIASEEQFQEQLAREGMTVDELKRNMERSILRQQVMRRDLEPKVMVTDTEVRAEYDSHQERFAQPATVSLREIFVKGDDAEARAKAASIVERARGGEDFANLARAESAAPSKASGGDLGKLAHGELNAALEKVAFSLPAGGVSDPIKSGDGFRVLKVEEKTDAKLVPFEEVKDALRRGLLERKMGKESTSYLAGLRQKATIDVRVREVATDLGGAVAVPSTLRDAALPVGDAPPPPGPAAAPAPAGDADDEIVTTPQARPEQVSPQGAPDPASPPNDKPKPPSSAP
jgi:peptidyl-prolyl cis-trans isomerase SurA